MATTTDTMISVQAGSSMGAAYTNSSGDTMKAKEIELHNTNSTTETVIVSIVPNSSGSVGTAADADKKWKKDVAADETIILGGSFPYILDGTNDTIQVMSTTASKVNVTIKGVIESA